MSFVGKYGIAARPKQQRVEARFWVLRRYGFTPIEAQLVSIYLERLIREFNAKKTL